MFDDWIWLLFIFLILFIPWDRVWDRLLGKEQEETMEPEHEVEDDAIFASKRECLSHAVAIRNTADTPEQIISVAQKFWDFLRQSDPEPEED